MINSIIFLFILLSVFLIGSIHTDVRVRRLHLLVLLHCLVISPCTSRSLNILLPPIGGLFVWKA